MDGQRADMQLCKSTEIAVILCSFLSAEDNRTSCPTYTTDPCYVCIILLFENLCEKG